MRTTDASQLEKRNKENKIRGKERKDKEAIKRKRKGKERKEKTRKARNIYMYECMVWCGVSYQVPGTPLLLGFCTRT